MSERTYACGCPYDDDSPDPTRCDQHKAARVPRVYGEGWIAVSVVTGEPIGLSWWSHPLPYTAKARSSPTTRLVKVRIVEVVE